MTTTAAEHSCTWYPRFYPQCCQKIVINLDYIEGLPMLEKEKGKQDKQHTHSLYLGMEVCVHM